MQADERVQLEDAGDADEPRRIAWLWFAVLGGPVAWFLGFNFDYALVRIACTEQSMVPLHLVTLLTLPIAVAAAWTGWREWQRAGGGEPDEGGSVLSRSRFMAVLGLLSGAFFALVIVAQWSAKLFLHPCMAL